MTFGRLFNGIKYIYLMNENNLKKNSLNDNIYFTLRDIFANCNTSYCLMANDFNSDLTNNIYFEDRKMNFKYSNSLYEIDYVYRLSKWLDSFNINCFEFENFTEGEKFEMEGKGLIAQIFQHETDHLEGILFTDKAKDLI